MSQIQSVFQDAKSFVEDVFSNHDEVFPFHNSQYASEVAEVAKQLGEESSLSEEELEILQVVALFYYSGYPYHPKKFIAKSRSFLEDFLDSHDLFNNESKKKALELLVENQTSDSSLLAKLLHDALVSYKGRRRFFRKAELLRLEKTTLLGEKYTEYEWEQKMFTLLVKCVFFTDAAKENYRKRHIENISEQRGNVNKAFKSTTRKRTGKEFGRGIDTLYRTNYRNQINLSSIADGKANMMISINTIILSVIVTLSGAGFTVNSSMIVEHFRFTIPIFILLIGSLTSVVFAVISARPKITQKKLDMEMITQKKTSLLFFGNFLQIPLDDYVDHLSDLKKDQQKLYDSMSIDMYYLGMVLQTKYKWLTWSYNTFMISLILCVISFIGIFIYTNR